MLCVQLGVLSVRNANIVMQTNRQTGIYQRDELTTKVYYIALDGETTNLNEFTNFCGVLLLIQQFVNSIKFVVLSPLRYESGRAERPRLSVIIIFAVSLIRLTDKLQFTAAKANIGGYGVSP